MSRRLATQVGLLVLAYGLAFCVLAGRLLASEATSEPRRRVAHRSPVDLVLAEDGTWLATANETSNTVSLMETKSGKVIDEIACGQHPAGIARCLGGQHLLVSCSYSGEVMLLEVRDRQLIKQAVIPSASNPLGSPWLPTGDAPMSDLLLRAKSPNSISSRQKFHAGSPSENGLAT